MDNEIEYPPHESVVMAKCAMTMQGRKQEDVARAIGKSRVLLNMYLNRKLNFLSEDIAKLLAELGIEKQVERLTGLNNDC